ncbi:hypothetical protein BDV11DRAFT_171060 [Aspergillus similis]
MILRHVLAQTHTQSTAVPSTASTNRPTVKGREGKFSIIITGEFFIGSSLPGQAVKRLRTVTNRTDAWFDITCGLSAPVVLNTGIGVLFAFGPDSTRQWSMPTGRTSGLFFWQSKNATLDETRSQTWFDRQWNVGPHPQLDLSIRISDSDEVGHRQWSTAQMQAGVNVVQAAWYVVLQDGTSLTIESAHEDQEFYTGAFSTYTGFVTVTGPHASSDSLAGYGLIKVQAPLKQIFVSRSPSKISSSLRL